MTTSAPISGPAPAGPPAPVSPASPRTSGHFAAMLDGLSDDDPVQGDAGTATAAPAASGTPATPADPATGGVRNTKAPGGRPVISLGAKAWLARAAGHAADANVPGQEAQKAEGKASGLGQVDEVDAHVKGPRAKSGDADAVDLAAGLALQMPSAEPQIVPNAAALAAQAAATLQSQGAAAMAGQGAPTAELRAGVAVGKQASVSGQMPIAAGAESAVDLGNALNMAVPAPVDPGKPAPPAQGTAAANDSAIAINGMFPSADPSAMSAEATRPVAKGAAQAVPELSAGATAVAGIIKSLAGARPSTLPNGDVQPAQSRQATGTAVTGIPAGASVAAAVQASTAADTPGSDSRGDTTSSPRPFIQPMGASKAGAGFPGAPLPAAEQGDVAPAGLFNAFTRAVARASGSESVKAAAPALATLGSAGVAPTAAFVLPLTTDAAAVVSSPSVEGPNQAAPIDDAALENQIVKAIHVQWGAGIGQATMQLDPEHLGAITVSLEVKGGAVSASVQAETSSAQQWISAHESDLRNSLERQGLTLERLVVHQDTDQQRGSGRQQRQQKQPSRQRRPADSLTFPPVDTAA